MKLPLIAVVCLIFIVGSVSAGWDAYVDSMIAHSADSKGQTHITRGSLISLNGGAGLTTTCSDKMICWQSGEAENIAKAFKNKDSAPLKAAGVFVEGIKYQFYDGAENFISAKAKNVGAVSIRASGTAVVIGYVPVGKELGQGNNGVDFVAKFLLDSGY